MGKDPIHNRGETVRKNEYITQTNGHFQQHQDQITIQQSQIA
jgi:hypothetical protein